jgi:hypothetical protein
MSVEVLKSLFESELLTDDTKVSIKEAFEQVITEAKETAYVEVTQELTEKFAKEYVADRDTLIESVDQLVTAALTKHITEHKADLESFRDLEAESATRLVEAKEELAVTVKEDFKALIEKLDSFLDIAITEEFEEIKADLVESQRNALGAKLFEGFRSEFEQFYVQQTGIAGQLEKLTSALQESQAENAALKKSLNESQRAAKMSTILSSLGGKPKQVMETILATVATDKLQETYDRYIDRVITEGAASARSLVGSEETEKETQVLSESKVDPRKLELKSGDTQRSTKRIVNESISGLSDEEKRRLLASAGLI